MCGVGVSWGAQAQGILAEVIGIAAQLSGAQGHYSHQVQKAWGQTGPGNDAQSSQFNSKSPL